MASISLFCSSSSSSKMETAAENTVADNTINMTKP